MNALLTQMASEAREAPAAIARQFAANAQAVATLAAELRRTPPAFVVTCARGSSDHAATFAKYLFETRLGLVTASAAPSLGSVFEVQPKLAGALYLVISQSGGSPDLVRNAELARRAGARVVALVNVTDSPLARAADLVLPLHAGPELSVAATKSYLCSLAALLQLASAWSDDRALGEALPTLPDVMQQALSQDWSPLVTGLRAARNGFIVARGLGLGAAQEIALKLKETCGLHAEAFSAAEVRHGPMAIVGPGFPVLCLAQDDSSGPDTVALADTFRGRGAQVWLARPGSGAGEGELPLPQSPHPACTPLLMVAAFYPAAAALSLARGLNPDAPPHLQKVTATL